MEEVIRSCETAHLYYGHFFVMRNSAGLPVATCSAYPYPDYDITSTYRCLEPVTRRLLGWTSEVFQTHLAKLDFLKTAFPDDVPWDNSWFLETIYTDPEYRGRGLSTKLIHRCLDEGRSRGATHSLLIAAQGNDAAQRVYLKQGYKLIGAATSDQAFDVLGCGGFDIFKFDF